MDSELMEFVNTHPTLRQLDVETAEATALIESGPATLEALEAAAAEERAELDAQLRADGQRGRGPIAGDKLPSRKKAEQFRAQLEEARHVVGRNKRARPKIIARLQADYQRGQDAAPLATEQMLAVVEAVPLLEQAVALLNLAATKQEELEIVVREVARSATFPFLPLLNIPKHETATLARAVTRIKAIVAARHVEFEANMADHAAREGGELTDKVRAGIQAKAEQDYVAVVRNAMTALRRTAEGRRLWAQLETAVDRTAEETPGPGQQHGIAAAQSIERQLYQAAVETVGAEYDESILRKHQVFQTI